MINQQGSEFWVGTRYLLTNLTWLPCAGNTQIDCWVPTIFTKRTMDGRNENRRNNSGLWYYGWYYGWKHGIIMGLCRLSYVPTKVPAYSSYITASCQHDVDVINSDIEVLITCIQPAHGRNERLFYFSSIR